MTSRIREVACALAVLTTASVLADDSVTARGTAIAATCSTCHHAGNEAIPPLEGRPATELLQRLEALAGDPQATVMARIAGALSETDRRAVAAALAASGHG